MYLFDEIRFVVFSLIEGIGIFFMMLSSFRLNPLRFYMRFLPLLVIMVFQSFLLREEMFYPFLVPVVNIILFVLFITQIMKIPLIWSFIITILGYFAFGIIQFSLIFVLFQTVEKMSTNLLNGYILQCSTALLQVIVSIIMLKYRIGFVAEFEKLRFKKESYLIIIMISISLIGIALVSISIYAMLIIMLSFTFFLLYSIRKERENY
jgi:hypothetical protein